MDKSAERIAHEFDVDWQNSTDKREVLDPDRFGYLSWHHIVTLSPNRAALPEYSQFEGLKVEIQTRSILQHGWAEIEHDIGYKTKIAVPRAYRRRLSRLAGLLELADQEFMSIRDGLDEYERNLPERIRRTPRLVEIDKASLSAYVENSAVVQEVDQEIAALAGIPLDPDPSDLKAETREADVAKLRLLQVDTIEELDAQLSQYKQGIVAFAGEYFSGRLQGGAFSPGISIWYLAYFLAGRSGEFETAAALMQINHSFFKGSRDVSVEDSARHILQTYELISDR